MAWAKSFPPCLHLPERKHTMDGHLQEVFGVIVAHRKIASKIMTILNALDGSAPTVSGCELRCQMLGRECPNLAKSRPSAARI